MTPRLFLNLYPRNLNLNFSIGLVTSVFGASGKTVFYSVISNIPYSFSTGFKLLTLYCHEEGY